MSLNLAVCFGCLTQGPCISFLCVAVVKFLDQNLKGKYNSRKEREGGREGDREKEEMF